MRKCYQNIVIDGQQMSEKHNNVPHYGESKWEKFIEPLLPKDCKGKTFIEIGCSEGLYLNKAKDKGFKRVIGIESNKDAIEWARKYRTDNGNDYEILHRKMTNVGNASIFALNTLRGEKCLCLTADELPVSDVVLLSNVHYFLPKKFILQTLDTFLRKTIYCIIVSWNDSRIKRKYKSSPSKELVENYFKNWEMVQSIVNERMYSILFKSNLCRYNITQIMMNTYGQDVMGDRKKLNRIFRKRHEKYLLKRGNSNEQIKKCKEYFAGLRKDIERLGIKEPILIDDEGKLVDGAHRMWIERKKGIESIIARQI